MGNYGETKNKKIWYSSGDKNVKFKGFEKSEYAKGNKSKVLSKYYNESFLPKTEKVSKLLRINKDSIFNCKIIKKYIKNRPVRRFRTAFW